MRWITDEVMAILYVWIILGAVLAAFAMIFEDAGSIIQERRDSEFQQRLDQVTEKQETTWYGTR